MLYLLEISFIGSNMTDRLAHIAYILLWIPLLLSCEMMDIHPYDVEIDGRRNINTNNAAKIERQCLNRDTIRFAVAGDTQGWYDDTRDFVHDVNRRDGIDFMVHVGDLTNYGTVNEFQWQRDILDKLRVPYVCVIGNHDCLGTGEDAYKAIYGATNYQFIAARVKFLMLNTNALEYDYGEAIPNFNFIANAATDRADEFDRTVVVMHAAPFSDVFNNNVALVFSQYIANMPNVMFCLNGHDHKLTITDIFDNGTLYFQTPNIAKRTYIIFTITPSGYDYETITY